MMVMLLFRCCSYCFEKHDEYDNGNIADYLNYIFYLPTFILGPVITYDKMETTGDYGYGDSMFLNYAMAARQIGVIIIKLLVTELNISRRDLAKIRIFDGNLQFYPNSIFG